MKNIDKVIIWIVIPAFNEASAIVNTVTQILPHFNNIVIVDDCSNDKTADLALSAGAHVISHAINLGQGAALQTGINYALQNNADFIVTFDADGQHNPNEISAMLVALQKNGCSVALGSRFLGKTIKMPWQRLFCLRMAIIFTNIISRIHITDVHNGFRILSRHFCKSFEFCQNRMAHASELLHYIADNKITYIEFPVTITYTHYSIQKGQKNINAFWIFMELLIGMITK